MQPRTLSWILYAFLSLTWGSSFILMKKSMFPVQDGQMVLDPYQVGSLRILIAGLILLPLAIKNLKKVNRKNLGYLIIAGFAGNFFPAFLFTLAETRIDSSLAGLLNMATTFFVVILGALIYKTLPTKRQWIGLLIGSAGLYLVLARQIDFEHGDLSYALLVILAALCYAISLTTIKFKLSELNPLTITTISFSFILIPGAVACLYFNSFQSVFYHPDGMRSLGYLSILAVVGTAIAVVLFTKLIAISSHVFSSAVAYTLPVVALIFGVLDGDPFHPLNLLWITLIFAGVYLMNRKSSQAGVKKGIE